MSAADWSASLAAETFITRATRKIAAEVMIVKDLVHQRLMAGDYLDRLDLNVLAVHFSLLQAELAEHKLVLKQSSRLDLLKGAVTKSTAWAEELCCTLSLDEIGQISETFFSEIEQILLNLSNDVISNNTSEKQPPYQLIEFDNEFSGVHAPIIESIVALEKQLLIDPNLKQQQEGFARFETSDEIRAALSLRESRLFILTNNERLEGFYIQELNSDSVRSSHAKICEMLTAAKIISPTDSIGYCRIVGISKNARRESSRQGIHLYEEIDKAVTLSAAHEGIDFLIGLVREGENANTSMKAHQRFGWVKTELFVYGSDGTTPYRVIVKPINYPNGKPTRARLGLNSHFDRWSEQPSLQVNSIDSATPISNSVAVNACHKFFSKLDLYPSIRASIGAYALYITVEFSQRPGILYNLHQLRPRTDFWNVHGQQDSCGPLSHALKSIAQDAGFVGELHEKDYYPDYV